MPEYLSPEEVEAWVAEIDSAKRPVSRAREYALAAECLALYAKLDELTIERDDWRDAAKVNRDEARSERDRNTILSATIVDLHDEINKLRAEWDEQTKRADTFEKAVAFDDRKFEELEADLEQVRGEREEWKHACRDRLRSFNKVAAENLALRGALKGLSDDGLTRLAMAEVRAKGEES